VEAEIAAAEDVAADYIAKGIREAENWANKAERVLCTIFC
jgi:hypothetical protein